MGKPVVVDGDLSREESEMLGFLRSRCEFFVSTYRPDATQSDLLIQVLNKKYFEMKERFVEETDQKSADLDPHRRAAILDASVMENLPLRIRGEGLILDPAKAKQDEGTVRLNAQFTLVTGLALLKAWYRPENIKAIGHFLKKYSKDADAHILYLMNFASAKPPPPPPVAQFAHRWSYIEHLCRNA